MNNINISQIDINKEFGTFLFINKSKISKARNDSQYLDMELMDKFNNIINAKIWNVTEDILNYLNIHSVVYFKGKIQLYNNRKQFIISEYRMPKPGEIDISDFIPTAPVPAIDMYNFIIDVIQKFKDEDLKDITYSIILERKEKLMYYPAAKSNHHSIRAGLLFHIYRMLKVASGIKEVYVNLDLNLLQAGIILHDICKTEEMHTNELGLVDEYTPKGNLLGHLAMGVDLIGKKGRELGINDELILLLQHMILAHHGKPEYGSAIPPMFLEAELLHRIDDLDAKVYDFMKIESELEEKTMSDRIFSLENRRIYKTNYKKNI